MTGKEKNLRSRTQINDHVFKNMYDRASRKYKKAEDQPMKVKQS